MGKSCLSKLPGNIDVQCSLPTVGISALYLIHAEDANFTLAAGELTATAVSFQAGARSYRIEGYKQNIQTVVSARSTDASNKLDVKVSFKFSRHSAFVRSLLTGRFYALEVYSTGGGNVWGIQTPLECTGMDWDSNANAGLITVTLAAPDGAGGNYLTGASTSVITSITNKAN